MDMAKQSTHSTEPDSLSFEQHLQQLESIVQQLETGQMDLSESLNVFEAGVQHLRHCHVKLREAEQKIALVVDVAPDGTARLKDFSEAASDAPERPRSNKRAGNQDPDRLF
jgi:exodeoxyribonuclease VII small subunit